MATKLEKIYKAPFMVEDYFIDLRKKDLLFRSELDDFMEGYQRKSNTATSGKQGERAGYVQARSK